MSGNWPPEVYQYYDTIWNELKAELDNVFQGHMDMNKYMTMYSIVYKYCSPVYDGDFILNKHEKGDKNKKWLQQWLHLGPTQSDKPVTKKFRWSPDVVGRDLYKRLLCYVKDSIKDLFQSAKGLSDEKLLALYSKNWRIYKLASKRFKAIFKYLERSWIRRQLEEGRTNIYEVDELMMFKWKILIVIPYKDRINNATVKMIRRERNGDIIDIITIKNLVESYLSMLKCEDDLYVPTLEFYSPLEVLYIEETSSYYKYKTMQYRNNNSISEYIQKVAQWMHEEYKRVNVCFQDSTKIQVYKICDEILIDNMQEEFNNEFLRLVHENKTIELRQLYTALSRSSERVKKMADSLENHIHEYGSEVVSKCVHESPRICMPAILEIHRKFDTILKDFLPESEFVAALANAVRKFIYGNPVMGDKFAEALAGYSDIILKSPKLLHRDEARIFDQLIYLYKLLEDKEKFEYFYAAMFVDRFVSCKYFNLDAELSMISKLKQVANITFTRKLQRILQEAECSPNAAECWSSEEDQSPAALAAELDKLSLAHEDTLRIPRPSLTLPRAAWPFPLAPLPISQRQSRDGDRNIALYAVSAVLATNCFRKPYTLHVSGAQALVLLQYNATPMHTITQLAQNTQIHIRSLRQTVKQLVEAGLLVYEGESRDSGCDSRSECRVSLNAEYSRSRAPSLYALARRDHYHASSLPLLQEWCVRSAKCARGARREEVSRQMRRHCAGAGRRTCTQLQAQECIEYLLSKRHLVEKEGVIKYWNQCVVKRNEREVCVDS